ncbi:MAG: diacylglycerol kinase [Gemmatimonadaceae bacterium]
MTGSAADYKSVGGLRRIANALRYSARGIRYAFTNEAAFRQELLAMLVLVPTAIVLPVSGLERLLLVLLMLLVLVVELLNTAVEATVDRVSMELHPLAGQAKDLGSAAVGISLLMCIVAWVVIAGPVVLHLL